MYALQISHKYSFHARAEDAARPAAGRGFSPRRYYDLLARREREIGRDSRLPRLARLTKTKPSHQFGGARERESER